MAISGYLIGARQRFIEFGGFSAVAEDRLPAALAQWADAVVEQIDPGLRTLVALAPLGDDDRVAAMLDDLVSLSLTLVREERTETLAVLLLVAEEPLTRARYDGLQAHKLHIGSVRVVPWLMDLARGHLFVHEGPPAVDQDLAMLAAPELPDPEPQVQPRSQTQPGRWAAGKLRLPATWATLGLLSIIAVIWVLMTITGGSLAATKTTANLIAWGAVQRPELWITGQYWRLLSAAFLHIGIEHLLMNGFSLWSVGRAVEVLFGPGRMLYIYFVAAIAGSLLSAGFGPAAVIGAGASGAIFGLLGAVVFYRISSPLGHRVAWRPLLTVLAINLTFGLALSRFIDNWNHVGGLLGGFAAAAAVGVPAVMGLQRPRLTPPVWVRRGLVLLLAALATAPVLGLVPIPGPGRDLARSYVAFDEGRFAEAEAGFRQAVQRQPESPELRYLLTWTYFKEGKCREAQGELNYLISLAQDSADLSQIREVVRRCLPTTR